MFNDLGLVPLVSQDSLILVCRILLTLLNLRCFLASIRSDLSTGRISNYSCSFSIASSHDIGTSTIFCSSHSNSFKDDDNCCSYASLEENFIARAIDY